MAQLLAEFPKDADKSNEGIAAEVCETLKRTALSLKQELIGLVFQISDLFLEDHAINLKRKMCTFVERL